MSDANDKTEILDACIKCSACTAMCPVAAVNPIYPGPKCIGPDAERFRLDGVEIGAKLLTYCSGCRTCEITCPSGIKITEMISRARQNAKFSEGKQDLRVNVRDFLLGRAEYLGKLATITPKLTNQLLSVSLFRKLLDQGLGISSKAPLPPYKSKFTVVQKNKKGGKQVVFFPGCFIKYNDAPVGQAIIKILEHNGYDVNVPSFHCCGAPLEGNGFFNQAEENAKKNLALMEPYSKAGIPIVTSCTTCGLALKEYQKDEKPGTENNELQVYDLFEFLWELHEKGQLLEDFKRVNVSLGYHAPCHLKAQSIGTPSVRLLRLIPGVKVTELDQGCCGLSGSYGFKKEKHDVAMKIGTPLFTRVRQGINTGEFESVITECGGCQVQIRHGSGAETNHSIWTLLQAYGLEITI